MPRRRVCLGASSVPTAARKALYSFSPCSGVTDSSLQISDQSVGEGEGAGVEAEAEPEAEAEAEAVALVLLPLPPSRIVKNSGG